MISRHKSFVRERAEIAFDSMVGIVCGVAFNVERAVPVDRDLLRPVSTADIRFSNEIVNSCSESSVNRNKLIWG